MCSDFSCLCLFYFRLSFSPGPLTTHLFASQSRLAEQSVFWAFEIRWAIQCFWWIRQDVSLGFLPWPSRDYSLNRATANCKSSRNKTLILQKSVQLTVSSTCTASPQIFATRTVLQFPPGKILKEKKSKEYNLGFFIVSFSGMYYIMCWLK